ncbi:MAG TPA: sulfotransferase, partial [Rhodanobacteraceae bacterium]|nr:sulfotransferase [Rhodanobacteraceae bacterium]
MAGPASPGLSLAPDASAPLIAEFARLAATGNARAAIEFLLDALRGRAELDWLAVGRALVLRSDLESAVSVFGAAHAEHPNAIDVRLALAGVLWQSKHADESESLLRALLAEHPDQVAATFLLAKILKEQGRMNAVAATMRALFEHARQPVGITIQAIELLDDCGCKHAAAELCENEIALGSIDARLYAYAGMLHLQLGDFERVRERYSFALAHSKLALDWQVANGLAAAQRYEDENHPDFALFRESLQRDDFSERARASVLFALGKAYDDIADHARAAAYFRQGNQVVHAFTDWSRKDFRRAVVARLDAKTQHDRVATVAAAVPVFIVGMPRSGGTLVAELLSRHPDVRYRGELAWLPFLAQGLARSARSSRAMLEKTAAEYLVQLRQDDAPSPFYIDKQPLNFLHIDLIAALFPNARIVYCQRNERDTALSIWMQYFASAEEGFAYDFADIAAVMQGCSRLMASAQKKNAIPIYTIPYERLATDSASRMNELAAWLGLSKLDPEAGASSAAPISTSSLWQVRQPVYTRSIGRWRAYAA